MKLNKPFKEFKIVAHRGFSEQFPENTREAYQAALSRHIDMLEIDLHMARDGALVAIHDESIDRTSNSKGDVASYTLEKLRSFDFGSWKKGHKEAEIMTFDEVLTLCKNYSKTLLIEIKNPKKYPGIEKAVIQKIKNAQFPYYRVIIQSFDMNSVQTFRTLTPYIQTGVLISKRKYWLKQPPFKDIACYADYINPNYKLANRKFIKRAHSENLKVIPYTVNDMKIAKKLIQRGVDGLITDAPSRLFKL
ncbi:glycerophosphodiester phosphodiesterase [Staphylococcus chromogenes]|uniref:glycerophosphodiester phosphodiesterase n=1 Tax=Staphylococcus chromogenes TaxID=46126 RepID=UPI000D1C1FD2|nr:glycerophosphodiester phosphodiesterase family protein [Staphylococcus chromogenes]MCE4966804.1 glycerophosphodiester phosphodiesterase [Staphylococcus chromogenes]MDT0700171.1 glycerophosphodiester phosphodiesterase family protein [Staphylococcus chromogenes]MDU0450396.1 glycerophosphodiester phosphodiesterase family protein [Staphylococcus chromogenes]PTF69396.1 glycerophosphodiester phosphodiesterase [Staphylococcus chromogenes]PTF73628.1 glycerophosphodiester phosphodiesterase [Staphylo